MYLPWSPYQPGLHYARGNWRCLQTHTFLCNGDRTAHPGNIKSITMQHCSTTEHSRVKYWIVVVPHSTTKSTCRALANSPGSSTVSSRCPVLLCQPLSPQESGPSGSLAWWRRGAARSVHPAVVGSHWHCGSGGRGSSHGYLCWQPRGWGRCHSVEGEKQLF